MIKNVHTYKDEINRTDRTLEGPMRIHEAVEIDVQFVEDKRPPYRQAIVGSLIAETENSTGTRGRRTA